MSKKTSPTPRSDDGAEGGGLGRGSGEAGATGLGFVGGVGVVVLFGEIEACRGGMAV